MWDLLPEGRVEDSKSPVRSPHVHRPGASRHNSGFETGHAWTELEKNL